ncbi:hypothetical protein SK128_015806 [Halocaridina rubra]|uniref:Uncharacterized protein n=1 Tax=Halocaridina rubra TaxID=373956 RepID=A0AAN8X363_HALRR
MRGTSGIGLISMANTRATWNGRVIVLDGEISSLGTSLDDQQYEIVMQLLLPDFPHIDTKFMCVTKVQAAEVSNNVTLLVGEGKTQRELQVYHSTSWRITDPIPTIRTTGDQTVSLVHYDYASLAARIENKLKDSVACAAADLSWDINHILQMTSKSMENLVEAKIGNENHKILTNFYDQSEEFFKYYIEIEISLPAWYFSYIDTLQQQQAGDMIGRSTTVMPSGRIYTTSSRLYKSNTFDRIIFEMSYDVTVQDDEKIWKIVAHLSFDWSSEHIHLQSRAEVGGSTIFGLELALDGMASTELEFHLKNWLKSTYEVQITLSNEGRKTDLNLGMILIPLNREIKSKVALGHDGCSIGVVDGELSWDVRGDASRTVTVSSVIQLPKDGRPLELKGSLAVLSWTWKTELIADLGKDIGDSHHLNYILVLPDGSSFELGSQFGFSLGENDLSLSTVFEVQMPNEDVHNISVLVQGKLHENKIADGLLTFSVQSPITEALQFQIQAKAERNEPQHNIGVLVNAYSEGNYWEPIEAQANGKWDGTKAGVALEVAWGTVTISFDSMGSYIVADGEHHITGTSEIKLPLGKSWQQLRGALDGTFSVGQNPGRLKITHLINVEKDYAEVFNMSGEVSLHVPKAEGKLVISHAGSMARYHEYILEGTFTGKELQVEIDGIIDDIPLHVSLHYIDGQEVTIKSYYRDENYFRIEVKTQLNDVSIAIRKEQTAICIEISLHAYPQVKGTSYSLTTEGLLVLRGRRTRLHHDLAISPLQASSTLRLSPFLGHVFELTISRTKYSKHHCSTVILLEWGDRKFSYHDEIYFPSYSECSIKVEIDAPYFNITQVQAHVQAEADSSGEQVVQIKYLVHNDTVHSARFMYFMHGSEDEMVWRAGARDVVISSEEYNDLLVTHEIILPVGGLEMKSNMTIGVIPIVGVGVTVNLHTRALLLSVCSTSEECVRVRAHAHSRSTPSMRTYSLAAHALNSLFWSLPDDSLIQNSIIFSAQEALDKVTVSGGLRRVECSQVTCENFVVRGVLHTTVQFTDDDVGKYRNFS